MIPNSARKVNIYITTYSKKPTDSKPKKTFKMDKRPIPNHDKKYVCSFCMDNTRYHNQHNVNCGKKVPKPCPICCKTLNCEQERRRNNENQHKCKHANKNTYNEKFHDEVKHLHKNNNTKNVQTSQTDLTQDISLLKEVLTVFQTKKQVDVKASRTVVMKDVSVETDTKSKVELTAKLTKSRTFQFSIEESNRNSGNNFKIINYSQPNNVQASSYCINLNKHKSSSIPQMKLEELKYSLKEKTKSKDAIEEVNRMFATVKRSDLPDGENRPMVRNGPRVLPVVKTKDFGKQNSDSEAGKTQVIGSPDNSDDGRICKCCQTNNMQMSGGDSFFKHDGCYHKMLCEGRCEKCVYMLCCHYEKHNKTDAGVMVCECCGNSKQKLDNCEGNYHCENF